MTLRRRLSKRHVVLPAVAAMALFGMLAALTGTASAFGHPSCPALTINTPTTLPNASIGSSYDYTLSASATTSNCPAEWFITGGTLPYGLHLNPSTGEITGTAPGRVESYGFQINVAVPGNVTSEHVALPVVDTITVDSSSAAQLTNGTVVNDGVDIADGGNNAVYRLSDSNPPSVLTPPSLTGLDFPESLSSAGGFVFASNFYGTNSVSSDSPAGNASVPGCTHAIGIAASGFSGLPQVAITCGVATSSVDLLTATGNSYAVTSSYALPSGGFPAGIVHVADDVYLVGIIQSNSVDLISLPSSGGSGSLLATVSLPSGSQPANIAWDPFHNTAYVADPGSNAVSQVAVSYWNGNWSLSDQGEISVGTAPFGVAINPFTKTLVVSNSGDDDADVISLWGRQPQILFQPATGDSPDGVVLVGDQAYVANQIGGDVTVFDASAFPSGPFHGRFGHWWSHPQPDWGNCGTHSPHPATDIPVQADQPRRSDVSQFAYAAAQANR